ncbi:DUF2306 domain-containing protein [Pseudonocardia sp. CA-107938]|uniref:DUF2306 domain-containing protein n=1 Tax=Pseudonocardia sp. CA-107938 TaxID=3240021 RepID=UPI003D934717
MRSATRTGTRSAWTLLGLGLVVGSTAIYPYVRLDSTAGRLAVSDELHYALLVGHVFTAMVALVLGPLQFVPAIRAHRRWHRRIGRVYVAAVVLAGVLAIPVALLSDRLLTQVGLTIPAVGWLVTAGLAVRAIRRGDVEAHRSWMTRNYALTFLAVTARLLVPLMLLAVLPFTGGSLAALAGAIPSAIPAGQVLGWVIDLAVAEALIRRRRARHRNPVPMKELS